MPIVEIYNKLFCIYFLLDFTCPRDSIKCKDNLQCIRSDSLCDYYENCKDKSDEDQAFCEGNMVMYACNFERA